MTISEDVGLAPSGRSAERGQMLVVGCIIVLVFVSLLTRFQTTTNVVLPFYLLAVDPGAFLQDLEIRNSVIPENSPLIALLLRLGGPPIHAPGWSVGLFLLTALVNVFFVIRIGRDAFGLTRAEQLLGFVAILIFADYKFGQYLQLSAVPDTATPGALAVSLRWAFVYFLLMRRDGAALVGLSITALVAAKAAWACYLLYVICLGLQWRQGARTGRDMVRLAGLVGLSAVPFLLAKLLLSSGGDPAADCAGCAREIYDNIRWSFPREDVPYALPFSGILLFVILAGLSLRAWRGDADRMRTSVLHAVLILNVAIYLLGALYFGWIEDHLFSPFIVLMSPYRGLEAGFLILLIFVAAQISRSQAISPLTWALLVVGLALFATDMSRVAWFGILCLGLATVIELLRRRPDTVPARAIARLQPSRIGLAVLITVFLSGYSVYKFRLPDFWRTSDNVLAYPSLPAELDGIRGGPQYDPDKRYMIVVRENGQWVHRWQWNLLLGLSRSRGNVYYILDVDVARRIRAQNQVSQEVLDRLDSGEPVDATQAARARDHDIVFIVPTGAAGQFAGMEIVDLTPSWVLARP